MARTGALDEADAVFYAALEDLAKIGARSSYDQVLTMWKWCAEHLEGRPERIEYLAEELRLAPT